ncbi:unnamed protein product [Clavelina lepadiformis]|uniref:Uncharacterized protein n=1 Tax=Clavelina lepadiformis TaxID=159417 RepID=A0ABP0G1S0_CLALP
MYSPQNLPLPCDCLSHYATGRKTWHLSCGGNQRFADNSLFYGFVIVRKVTYSRFDVYSHPIRQGLAHRKGKKDCTDYPFVWAKKNISIS